MLCLKVLTARSKLRLLWLGTEPKIKFYFGVTSDSEEGADEKIKALRGAVVEMIK